jgi:hypothetical protein
MKNNQKISIFIAFVLTAPRLPRPFHWVLVGLQRPPPRSPQESAQQDASDESANVRPKRNSADLLRASQSRGPAKQLGEKPKDQIKDCRNLEEEWEKEYWKQKDKTRGRKKHKISAKHTSDCARRAHRRDGGVRSHKQLRQGCDNAAGEIKNRETHRPHTIFHVVAENPERPHIHENMQPTAVKELVRQNGPVITHGKTDVGSPIWMSEARRNESKQVEELFDRSARKR